MLARFIVRWFCNMCKYIHGIIVLYTQTNKMLYINYTSIKMYVSTCNVYLRVTGFFYWIICLWDSLSNIHHCCMTFSIVLLCNIPLNACLKCVYLFFHEWAFGLFPVWDYMNSADMNILLHVVGWAEEYFYSFFHFIDVMYNIDQFSHVEPSLHSRDKIYLLIGPFNMLLNSVC